MEKQLYEVYKEGTFVAVAKPGSMANHRLRAAGMFPITDILLSGSVGWPAQQGESVLEQAKKQLAKEGR